MQDVKHCFYFNATGNAMGYGVFFAVVGFLGFLVLRPDACTLQPINGNVTLVFNELGKLPAILILAKT